MNNITGEPEQIELGSNPQIGGPSVTDDVGIELITDTSNWFLETDVDGSNRPFKIRKTQIATDNGECMVFDDAGALQLPQIVGGSGQVLGVDADGNITAVASGGAVAASSVSVLNAGGAAYTNVQEMNDTFHSAGLISGGGITNAGGGSITIATGEGLVRNADSSVAPLYYVSWSALTTSGLTNLALNYVCVDWNAGTPAARVQTSPPNSTTCFELGTVYRDGSTLHITEGSRALVGDHAEVMITRQKNLMYIAREQNGGAIITETGTRNIAITSGTFWIGLTSITTAAVDTSVSDTFGYYYFNSPNWVLVASQTQIDNTQYNNSGTLTTLANNQYGLHWIYVGMDGDVYVLYGTSSYTLADAESADAPTSFPDHFTKHAILIGRIIIQKSASTFQSIESAFTTAFTGGASQVNQVNGVGTNNAIALFDSDGNTLKDSAVHLEYDGTNQNLFVGTDPSAIVVGSAQNNYAIGVRALDAVTTGDGNIAIGTDALTSVDVGTYNIAIGHVAGSTIDSADKNVCIGQAAGQYLVSNDNNTFVGDACGQVATGNANTFLGGSAGRLITTGTRNTCLGKSSAAAVTGTNQTAVGFEATCDADNQVTLGDANVTQLRVMSDGACDVGDATHRLKDVYASGDYYGGIPTHTTASRLTSPATGQWALNTTTNYVEIWDGTDWRFSDGTLPVTFPSGNLIAHYDASDSSSITHTTGTVSQWDDISGNGNHLDNVISSPRYGDDTQNGYDVVTFTDDAITETTFTGIDYSDHCVFIACHMNTTNGDTYFGTGTASSAGDVLFNALGTDEFRHHIWNDVSSLQLHDTSTKARQTFPAVVVARFVNNVKVSEVYVNGVKRGSKTLTGGFSTSSKGFALGSIGVTEGTTDYRVFEALVYESSLTNTEVYDVSKYLMRKWGI